MTPSLGEGVCGRLLLCDDETDSGFERGGRGGGVELFPFTSTGIKNKFDLGPSSSGTFFEQVH